jgi:tetratricopeptide (TPR) repeat protein
MIRLLINCPDTKKWKSIKKAMKNESPLVRSAAAIGLQGNWNDETRGLLINALNDSFKNVRLAAAISLAGFPSDHFTQDEGRLLQARMQEYEKSLFIRMDDWSSHYNLGNFYSQQGQYDKAIKAYENAIRIYPQTIMPLINSSLVYSMLGDSRQAELNLRKAIELEPESEAAYLNLGLLLAEMNQINESEKAFRKVLEINPEASVAAYNLSVIVAERDINEAVKFVNIAVKSEPEEPKYKYTLAYYTHQKGDKKGATKILEDMINKFPDYFDAIVFLGQIYEESKQINKAINLYKTTLKLPDIHPELQSQLNYKIKLLEDSN